MDAVLMVLGIYLLVGVLVLLAFDLITKRVRTRLKTASFDTMVLTGSSNQVVAIVLTILALWLLWPAAIYAAIRG